MSSPEHEAYIEDIERRIKVSERWMAEHISECLYPAFIGPPPHPLSGWVMFARLAGAWWYGVREWIAGEVLRVDLAREEDW